MDPHIYQKVDAALCPVVKKWKPVAADARNTTNFSFSTQPATDIPVFCSITLGDIVSNMFSSACIDADPHIFQTVDMSVHPAPALTEKASIIATKIVAALAEPPSIVETPAPPPLPMLPSSTTAVAPPQPSSSASRPRPTRSQVVSDLFDIMPSQIQRDLAHLDDMYHAYVSETEAGTQSGSDHEETNM